MPKMLAVLRQVSNRMLSSKMAGKFGSTAILAATLLGGADSAETGPTDDDSTQDSLKFQIQ